MHLRFKKMKRTAEKMHSTQIDREVLTGPRPAFLDGCAWRGRINRHKVRLSCRPSFFFQLELNFPVIFFQLFSAALAYFGLPAEIGESELGGVEGGVIGEALVLDEAIESSLARLSPLAFADGPSAKLGKCEELLCHPSPALNGEMVRGRLPVEEVGLYDCDISWGGGGDPELFFLRSTRSSKLPPMYKSSEDCDSHGAE